MNTYKKKLNFFRNKAVTKEILSLDPVKDHCRMVHLMSGYEFPWDMVRSLEIGLMRTFCSASVSKLLHNTGEFRRHGQKRYDDTAILVAEFMQNGYDSEKGTRAIMHMNKIHGLYKIPNDDFVFVLSTFIFQPIEWINNFGWRKLYVQEEQALFYFFREVAIRMNIKNVPPTAAALKEFVRDYEKNNFDYKETNNQVGSATINIVKKWLPGFAAPLVLPVLKCLLDEAMLKALGFGTPSALLKKPVWGVLKLRAFCLRKITFKKYPSFFTIEKIRTYPKGYEIENIGPEHLINKI
jgi:hypothetical protein